jgi:hypothetical protein
LLTTLTTLMGSTTISPIASTTTAISTLDTVMTLAAGVLSLPILVVVLESLYFLLWQGTLVPVVVHV